MTVRPAGPAHEAWMRRAMRPVAAARPGAGPWCPATVAGRAGGRGGLRPGRHELAAARNERELTGDPTAHAEILGAAPGRGRAGQLAPGRLHAGGDPGAVHDVRRRAGAGPGRDLVFGAWEPKTGAVGSLWDVVRDRRLNHRPEVYAGVLDAENAQPCCATFFR